MWCVSSCPRPVFPLVGEVCHCIDKTLESLLKHAKSSLIWATKKGVRSDGMLTGEVCFLYPREQVTSTVRDTIWIHQVHSFVMSWHLSSQSTSISANSSSRIRRPIYFCVLENFPSTALSMSVSFGLEVRFCIPCWSAQAFERTVGNGIVPRGPSCWSAPCWPSCRCPGPRQAGPSACRSGSRGEETGGRCPWCCP